uniref:Zinc knuckle CX2CX4HX4C domain-containing protein n=1 Tax=Chenopodium quinoa TaxID=63459 RepID=A0A803M8G9_CHEQI
MENNQPQGPHDNGHPNEDQQMGVLAAPPANFTFLGPINYDSCAIGVFLGPYPPAVTFVQHIVNCRWIRRGYIHVHQSGIYFLFECFDAYDLDGIIRQHSAVFEGRLINLRRAAPVISNKRMGFIEEYEQVGTGLPMHADIRVRMLIDTSQPLIPGCYVPVEGDRVVWVFFRYEGIFKFCKSCGFVGHSEKRCKVKKEISTRRLRCRLSALERRRLRVLYGPGQQAYYTNYVKGLPDIFRYRNPEVNLMRPEEPEDLPFMDRNGGGDMDISGSSSDSGGTERYYSASSGSSDSDIIESSNAGDRSNVVWQTGFDDRGKAPMEPLSPPIRSSSPIFVSNPAPPSTFEVGESSTALTLLQRRRVLASSFPSLIVIAPPPLVLPMSFPRLLEPRPVPTIYDSSRDSNREFRITTAAYNFFETGQKIARNLRLSRNNLARVFLEGQPTRSLFVGSSPTIDGTNLPNVPLT